MATTKTFPSFSTNTSPASGDYLVGYYADGSTEFKATLDIISPFVGDANQNIRPVTGNNTVSNCNATVGGGYNNTACRLVSTVSGGRCNTASGNYSTVSGGDSNNASQDWSAVGGGYGNISFSRRVGEI